MIANSPALGTIKAITRTWGLYHKWTSLHLSSLPDSKLSRLSLPQYQAQFRK